MEIIRKYKFRTFLSLVVFFYLYIHMSIDQPVADVFQVTNKLSLDWTLDLDSHKNQCLENILYRVCEGCYDLQSAETETETETVYWNVAL